jgi:hypothetical protein
MKRVGTTATSPALKYFDAKMQTAKEAHRPPPFENPPGGGGGPKLEELERRVFELEQLVAKMREV